MKVRARLAKLVAAVRPNTPTILRNSYGAVGLYLVAFGFHEAWSPLGYIVGGLELVVVAFLTAMGIESHRRRDAAAAAEKPAGG
jgi:hypothetical protein